MTVLLLLSILVAFACMTRGWLRQEVAMPAVTLWALVLAGPHDAELAMRQGFAEFARIALLFTAVVVPTHMLQRAGALRWVGLLLGEGLGIGVDRWGVRPGLLVPGACLFLTYTMAALFHNTTAILVCTSIIVEICQSYQLRTLPVLSGALVASNLGGFSTKWGDTPNLTEAAIWGLQHQDFFLEILPINVGLMCLLSAGVSALLWRDNHTTGQFSLTYARVGFRRARQAQAHSIDWRLLCIGSIGLAIAVVGPMIAPSHEFALSALAILFCCVAERATHRTETLLALGLDTYATLCAIFVLAQVLTHSSIGIGEVIQAGLEGSGRSVWAIAVASYLGTLFTEAASWATAVASIIHASDPTHAAAWALGAGICAGSSSLVTAASAGIILTRETQDYKEEARVTFGAYLPFGLGASLGMLAYYVVVLSILW